MLLKRNKNLKIHEAFEEANDVLLKTVQGINDLLSSSGIIYLDYSDIKQIIRGNGEGLIGFGEARGKDAVINAVKMAITPNLFNEGSIEGARNLLINFTCSSKVDLDEINEALNLAVEKVDKNADIHFGVVTDENEPDLVKVFVIATRLKFQ